MSEGNRLMRAITKIAAATGLICMCLMSPIESVARDATKTPIHHLIVIVGENRSFDHLFATYRPMSGQRVANLLSEGIIDANGAPGPSANRAIQWQAIDHDRYSITPTRTSPFVLLPQPNTTYAFGRKPDEPDTRFPADLPNRPFQISRFTAYQNSFTGDPVHRFFQMWQQFDQGKNDLFPWVAITAGMGSEGKPPPAPFANQSTHQGSRDGLLQYEPG
jgi:phospholipase C